MENIELLDIADDLLIINKTTIERLFQEDDTNVLVLYMFYYKTAKWQKHNPIKASDDYCTKCLRWGIKKVKNIKRRLKEMELISVEKRINEKKQIDGWYVKINYFVDKNISSGSISRGSVSSGAVVPLVAKRDYKILNNNNINTINNKNTNNNIKDIVEQVINHLNLKTNKSYKSTTNKTKDLIKARINEGFTLDDFKKVIDIKTSEWLEDTKMNKFLRPETLFSNKFEGYLNQENVITTKEVIKKIKYENFFK